MLLITYLCGGDSIQLKLSRRQFGPESGKPEDADASEEDATIVAEGNPWNNDADTDEPWNTTM